MSEVRMVDSRILNEMKNGKLNFLLKLCEELDLFMGIRDGAVSIFAFCGEIISLKMNDKEEIIYQINPNDYFTFNAKGKRKHITDIEFAELQNLRNNICLSDKIDNVTENFLENYIKVMTPFIKKHIEGEEKEIQHKLLIENNKLDTNILVLDNEVNFKGKSNSETGRTDTLAFDYVNNIIYLIEVKRGANAYKPGKISEENLYGSGIAGHFFKYFKIIDEMKSVILKQVDILIDFYKEFYNKKLPYTNDETTIEMVMYLFDFNLVSYKNYLGTSKNKNATMNVKSLIKEDKIYNKYVKEDKTYNLLMINDESNGFNLSSLLPNKVRVLEK